MTISVLIADDHGVVAEGLRHLVAAEPEICCHDAASRAGAMAFVNKRAIGSDLMQVLEELMGRSGTEDDGAP